MTVKQTILSQIDLVLEVDALCWWRVSWSTVVFVFAQEFIRLPLISNDSRIWQPWPHGDNEMNCFVFPRSWIVCNSPSVLNCGKHWTAIACLGRANRFLQHDVRPYCSEAVSSWPNNVVMFSLCLCVRVQSCGLAVWAGQERALVWRIFNWSPLPREWCHYDRDGQLRSYWWQDLWRWPIPDGECQLLPPRCLQDCITKVKGWE